MVPGGGQPRLDGLSLSSEKLEPHGLYLLENGVDALIYIGKEAPARLVQELLGELKRCLGIGEFQYDAEFEMAEGRLSYRWIRRAGG